MANACTVQPHQSTCTYMYVRLYTPGRRRRHSWRRQHCKLAGRRRAASLLAGAGLRDRTRMVHARDDIVMMACRSIMMGKIYNAAPAVHMTLYRSIIYKLILKLTCTVVINYLANHRLQYKR